MSELSTKPYLLRALYEWCLDSGHTPHIAVWVNEHTRVPMQFVRDNEIVLNIGPNASHKLVIDNEWVHFSARFGGVSEEVWIPVGHVVSLFARESGEGMGFEVAPWAPAATLTLSTEGVVADSEPTAAPAAETEADAAPSSAEETKPQAKGKKGLKLVK